jgi:transcriptional regulator with XRE-family HTH domain|nr:MAG TPA: helix-turn-helix domain protein [Caudoviricetes sp.]
MAGYTKNQIEHFKEQLKLLMKSHNLTARKLSKEIGYSMNTISSLLTGKTKVHEYHIKMICEYFEVGEKPLMGDADELADYKLYENGRYLCTGSLKKLSKITGKDKLLLKFYADLNKKSKETGNLKLVKK